MKKNGILTKVMIVEAIVAVAWAGMALGFNDLEQAGFYFWGGFTCALVSFAICIGSLFLIQQRDNRNLAEINVIPVWVSMVYLGVSVFINTIFVIIKGDGSAKPLIFINVVMLVAFIAARMFTDNYAQRVDRQTKAVVEKIQPVQNISVRVGVILGMATDPDVKKKLYGLKEMIDYSSNTAQYGTEAFHSQFMTNLGYIEGLISSKAEKEAIIEKIDEAAATWRGRNSVTGIMQ